jgi:hypothetical protein
MNTLDEITRRTLWKEFHKDGRWFKTLGRRLDEYRNGRWPRSFVDCVFQYDWHHPVDIYDIYVLSRATVAINSAQASIGVFQIPLHEGPLSDKDVEGNNHVLGTLPAPFEGKFWGGTQDEDGVIRWTRPIHVSISASDRSGWFLVAPGSVELEVGYNSSGKFLRALECSNGIARWPYGQPYITVFLSAAMKWHTPEHPDFDRLRAEANETIETCVASGRSPWERWRAERKLQRKFCSTKRTPNSAAEPA